MGNSNWKSSRKQQSKNNAIAVGAGSGFFNQGTNSVALGLYSWQFNQGDNCVSIGPQSGIASQPNSSIVINAGNLALNGVTQNVCNIQPITNFVSNVSTSNLVCYDNTNKELAHASNIQFANPVSFPLGTVTQASVNFGTQNTGIWSSSANSVNLSVDGAQRIDLTGSRLSLNIPIQNTVGSQSAPSIYYSTDTTSGIYIPALNNIGISTNSTLRFNVTTSAINCSLPTTLPTTGGTTSSLDYYEETTFMSAFTY